MRRAVVHAAGFALAFMIFLTGFSPGARADYPYCPADPFCCDIPPPNYCLPPPDQITGCEDPDHPTGYQHSDVHGYLFTILTGNNTQSISTNFCNLHGWQPWRRRDGASWPNGDDVEAHAPFMPVFMCIPTFPVPSPWVCCTCFCTAIAVEASIQMIHANHSLVTRRTFGYPPANDFRWSGLGQGSYEIGAFASWMIIDWFGEMIAGAVRGMLDQATAIMMHQAMMVGAFFDAQHQMDTQLLFQKLTAQAHKDYHPSPAMCMFGTLSKSLAASDMNAKRVHYTLSQWALDRELGTADVAGGGGPDRDREGRLEQFKRRYCDPKDNFAENGQPLSGFGTICAATATVDTRNRDIDFSRTVLWPRSLDVSFRDDEDLSGTEQDVIALASNLYAHDVFSLPSNYAFETARGSEVYLNMRSVVAKRAVAENSFFAIIGLKAQGSPESAEASAPYFEALLKEITRAEGMQLEADMGVMLGSRPSYFAQMEVLAKRIYQRPAFYVDLYDKPANIKRRSVAMQAVGLMLDRDLYNSYLRSEAIMSVLLETQIMDAQQAVEDNVRSLNP